MKKLGLLILIAVSTNCFSQIINFTYSPQANNIGMFYITKSRIDLKTPIHFYSSFEHGCYPLLNTSINTFESGLSLMIDETHESYFNIAPAVNIFKDNNMTSHLSHLTIDFGFTVRMAEFKKPVYLSIFYDYMNSHFKFGIGIKI